MAKTIDIRSNQSLLTRAATSRVLLPSEFQDKARLAIRTLSKILLSAVLFALVNTVANAQETAPPSPIQIISNSEFNQMVETGQLSVASPEVLLDQYLQRLLTDLKNQAVVDEFILQNPNLTDFAKIVAATPTDPSVYRLPDGNYKMVITNRQGQSQVIETMGQGTKLASLANSIQTASDPVRQLALYQSLYSQYTALYNQLCTIPVGAVDISPPPVGCADLAMPSALTNPSALTGASLEVIQSALQSIGSQGANILKMAPPPVFGPVSCSEEVGASSAPGVNSYNGFGDQTRSYGGVEPCVPYVNGIVANYNFPSKSLLSCIKNQGQRGTCHIFAATSALEELIARDTGVYVNLSEQDFTEHEKLIWNPDFLGDGGGSLRDLQNAATNGYHFAYENEWDYNPSLFQTEMLGVEYLNSCENYPYPSIEPGCSDSAPQAPEYCTYVPIGRALVEECGFSPVVLPGSSPYMSNGAVNVWNPGHPVLSVGYIQLALAFNNAVILGFHETNAFQGSNEGYVPCCGFDLLTTVGDHFVHVVGYVDNSDLPMGAPPGAGGGYFIIKNSWGACTGDAGYYYMPVTYLELEAGELDIVSAESH